MPEQLEHMIPVIENEIEYDISKEQLISLLPYILYKFRWSIEVVFYEQKTYWSFGKYMLRSITCIENYVNIINVCYTCMTLLPWKNKNFAELKGESPQHIKSILGQQIQYEFSKRRRAFHLTECPGSRSVPKGHLGICREPGR